MIHTLSQRTQLTIITKIKAHANIVGNEHANNLAKLGNKLPQRSPLHPYEKAHKEH
jgi:ribonuclease HI